MPNSKCLNGTKSLVLELAKGQAKENLICIFLNSNRLSNSGN